MKQIACVMKTDYFLLSESFTKRVSEYARTESTIKDTAVDTVA